MSVIQNCIEIHNQFAKCTPLSNTLGDGFMYQTSPIFKRVRDLLTAQNYTFKNELCEETNEFFLTQLFQLDKIYFEKKLFARHNYQALMKIALKFPDKDITLPEITTLECYSALLHESVHCLCQQYFGWASLDVKNQPDPEKFFQELITAESMAISTEFLACIPYSNTAERSLAYMNSLGYINAEDELSFKQFQKLFGFETAVDWLFRGYFASNYFYEAVALPPGVAKTFRNKELAQDPRYAALTEAVMNIGFRVNKPFRQHTAQTFFKLVGVEGGLKNAMTFDIYKTLQDGSYVMKAAKEIFSQYLKTEEESYAKGS